MTGARDHRSPSRPARKRVQRRSETQAGGDTAAPGRSLGALPLQRRCACGGRCPGCADKKREGLQTRLEIGDPDDAFEQEAERVAEQVVAAAADATPPPAPPNDPPPSAPNTPPNAPPGPPPAAPLSTIIAAPASPAPAADVRLRVHRSPRSALRRCACGGGCSACKDDARKRRLQREGGGDPARYHDVPDSALLPSALGVGQALDARTRGFVEREFGSDFSAVRIHTGSAATRAASAIDAQAYTYGRDIVFNAGQYAPHTRLGLHLLAHELTHVVQQGAAGPASTPVTIAHAPQARVQRQDLPGIGDASGAEDSCPATPTGLGRVVPAPACPHASHIGSNEVRRWRFCLDSDHVLPGETLRDIATSIAGHHRNTRYLVHGHASTDGDADYNLALACHRANAVGDALRTALATKLRRTGSAEEADLRDRIEVATRGETSEFGPDPADNRLVVLYAEIPGAGAPDEPDCADAPRHLGDIAPEVPCDRATLSLLDRSAGPQLEHFQFCTDSDVFNDQGARRIAAFAARQASVATFVVHGFASSEGDSAYNQRLSCHRAQRVARELLNAGVRPEQLREVAGLGETDAFSFGERGMEGVNRVAVVLAEDGAIQPLRDPERDAQDAAQKRRIVELAQARLVAGQYEAAADAYISRWTCGRTATVRQAAQRLNVSLPEGNNDEPTRDGANGQEENSELGLNGVRMSNNALHAENPIECVMGRLVDMAFHHAVRGDADLPPDLLIARPEKENPTDNAAPPSPRHLAGLHLIHLAGLGACRGNHQTQNDKGARGPTGIDAPRSVDPRQGMPLPACASAPQPTRSSGTIAGDERLAPTDFLALGTASPHLFNFQPRDGRLSPGVGNPQTGELKQQPMAFISSPVMNASTTLQMLGHPGHFADYEVGFMQAVMDDMLLAEYVDGSLVLQQLPVPIRAAHARGDTVAPAPWTGATTSAVPDAQGQVSLRASWKQPSGFALTLGLFHPTQSDVVLDSWQRHTRMGLWLAARRRSAPLDRFGVVLIDGLSYDIDTHYDQRTTHIRGRLDLAERDVNLATGLDPDREALAQQTQFRTLVASDDMPDRMQARFDSPVASEIDVFRQFQRIVAPPSAAAAGQMSMSEYIHAATEILDHLKVRTTEQVQQNQPEHEEPRLGFVFSPMDVSIRVNTATGRMLPYLNTPDDAKNPVQIESPSLADGARQRLARALALRLHKRDFLGTGQAAILRTPPRDGVVRFHLDPLQAEPMLIDDPEVRQDMAQMWACSEVTQNPVEFIRPREFAAAYGRDRDSGKIRSPAGTEFFMGTGDEEHLQTTIDCGPIKAQGYALGTVHTHPEDDADSPSPSKPDKDAAATATCGHQHYIVSEAGVTLYRSDGRVEFLGTRQARLPHGAQCGREIPTDTVD